MLERFRHSGRMRVCGIGILVMFLATGAGCSGKKSFSPEEYYDAASSDMRSGAYSVAVEKYRDLLDEHPFSEFSEDAELKASEAVASELSEVLGALGDYVTATSSTLDEAIRHGGR